MSTLRFEVRDDDSTLQPFYWRITVDADIWAKSETYHNKADALHGANVLKTEARTGGVSFSTFQVGTGWRWRAVARNGKILVSASGNYPTLAAAEATANWIKNYAHLAEVVDVTRTAPRR